MRRMKPSSTTCRQKTMNKVEGSMHLTSYNDKIDGNKLKKIKNLTKLYPNEMLYVLHFILINRYMKKLFHCSIVQLC
jgi:hypothetical protein